MTVRVLQVLLAPAIGGAETLAHGLEQGLASHGLEVETTYLDEVGKSPTRLARIRRFRAAVRTSSPDVILTHSALPNLYARVCVRRIPVITVLHSASRDFDNPVLRLAERLLQRRTRAVIAVSAAQAAEYESAFGTRVGLHTIPNGVSSDLPMRVSRSGGPITVLTMARINAQKDPGTWRGAALTAVHAQPNLSFSWYGPASSDPDQQALVDDTGHSSVSWAGPTTDVGSVLAHADVYFHSARAEAHPLAPLEAAAVGLPIICSEAVAGCLPVGLPAATFLTGDAASAAAAVLRVTSDLEHATRHASKWSAKVRLEFGLDRVSEAYAEVLHQAVPGRSNSKLAVTPFG